MPPFYLLFLAVIAVISMSTVPVLIKSVEANEYTIAFARLLIATAFLTPIVSLRSRLKRLTRRDWLHLLLMGSVFAAHWLSYFVSIKLSTASIGALAISTFGVQYLILAWLINKESIGPADWLAIITCLIGCFIIAPEFTLSNDVSRGLAVGVVSGLLYACMPLLHQRAVHIDTLTRTWGQFSFALLVILPFWPRTEWQLSTVDIYKLITLGILCTIVAHGLWVKVSTELPALYTSSVYYLYVPLAMLSSAFFLDEELTGRKVLGAILIVSTSTGITVYRLLKSRHRETV